MALATRKAASEVGSTSHAIGRDSRDVGSPTMMETAAQRPGLDKVDGEKGEKEGTWAPVAHWR